MKLLDSDIVIDILRGFPPAVAWLGALGDEEIALPGFVAMELIQGCQNKVEQRRVETLLTTYEILWPSPDICDQALLLYSHYHLSHRLGLLDALIGQISVSLNVPLHTFNQKHYAVISGLRTVQPYSK
jgi:predicted nucleic acid-binding protein